MLWFYAIPPFIFPLQSLFVSLFQNFLILIELDKHHFSHNIRCGNNTIGCASNLDCLPGHECIIKEDGFHFCRDINECTDPR